MNFPLVSIVTVNYNEPEVTRELLRSIVKNSYKNVEVIVVDNGCTKGTKEIIDAEFPSVILVESEENLGFSGGNNLGIKVAKGNFVFLVNNDTEFTDGLIESLLERLALDPKMGVACPKIRFFDSPTTIQFAGYTPVNPFTARNSAYGSNEEDRGQCEKPLQIPYGHGAALMVRKEVFEKAGLLPEMYFLYYEELDWCQQITNAGYTIWYEPKALIYHKESVSVGRMSPFKTYYLTRNRILFMKRNMSFLQNVAFALFFMFLTIPKNTVFMILKGQWGHLKAFWLGILWHFNIKNNLYHD